MHEVPLVRQVSIPSMVDGTVFTRKTFTVGLLRAARRGRSRPVAVRTSGRTATMLGAAAERVAMEMTSGPPGLGSCSVAMAAASCDGSMNIWPALPPEELLGRTPKTSVAFSVAACFPKASKVGFQLP